MSAMSVKRSTFLMTALMMIMVMVMVILLAGEYFKGDSEDSNTGAPSQTTPQGDKGDTGVLVGRVRFEGTVPPTRQIQVNKDESVCHLAAGEVRDVVVSADNALSEVVIEIQGIKQQDKQDKWEWKTPEGGYIIRQKGCQFQPRLLVVPAGAELTIYNDDPILHNINTGQWNIAQPKGLNRSIKKRINYEGRPLIRVNCNVHSWMEAWIYVVRSPYYATTGADGKFKIENIPPGSYKVTATHPTHPTLRTEKFQITIGSGQTVEQVVTFRSK